MPRPHELLLDLAAARPPGAVSPPAGVELVRSALEHRMHGLLWSSVEAGLIVLPQEPMLRLSALDLAVRTHHERLWRTLADVQRRLATRGVHTAAAKGITAEQRWYHRVGERPSMDIDLLVEPGGRGRIADILDELHPGHPLRDQIARLVRRGMLQSVDLIVDGVAIDVHLDLLKVEIPTRSQEAIWSRTRLAGGKKGIEVRVLDCETSLIHFAIHLNKDRFARLLGYADIARILGKESLDWEFIHRLVANEGLQVPVINSLEAVARTLRLPPLPVPRVRGWRSYAWHRLWPDERRLRGYEGIAAAQHRQLWIPWLAEGRMKEALWWWIRRRAIPPTDLLQLHDPDVLGPYPLRFAIGRLRGWRKRRRAVVVARRAGRGPTRRR